MCSLKSLLLVLVGIGLLASVGGCSQIDAHFAADKGYQAYLKRDYEGAIKLYNEAIDGLPKNAKVNKNLAFCYIAAAKESKNDEIGSKHYDSAIAILKTLVTNDQTDKQVAGVLLDTWIESGRLGEASSFYAEKIVQDQKNPEGYRLLGMIELRRGNYSAALAAYESRIKLQPNDANVLASKATLVWEWLRAGGPKTDIEAIEVAGVGVDAALAADKLDPKHPSALVYAGLLLRERSLRQKIQALAKKDVEQAETYLKMVRSRRQATDSESEKQISMLNGMPTNTKIIVNMQWGHFGTFV